MDYALGESAQVRVEAQLKGISSSNAKEQEELSLAVLSLVCTLCQQCQQPDPAVIWHFFLSSRASLRSSGREIPLMDTSQLPKKVITDCFERVTVLGAAYEWWRKEEMLEEQLLEHILPG